ncbi:LPS-assembly protein LptD [Mariprofundus sp. EBB-1]|uniref:LPS-assembly protein LptD n=1 Tax=Mariprofundus sp. EBB-1 TaxID=2650971 RepID=UPI001F2BA0BE|nr:LPS assembly protein LptD [Mariprofundus sp. EBB-1]
MLMSLLLASNAAAGPVDIDADEISRNADGVVIARGHVVIKREWDTLMADEVVYRTKEHVLEAKGHVVIKSDKSTIQTDKAIMQTQSKTGHMNHAVISLPGGERLTAERVKRIDDQTYEAEKVLFSSCPIDEESWRVAASRAVLDQHDGSLTATHARFELWQIPVLYAPWWQQPLKRKSGLLMPTVATGKRRGTELSMPYYIAPQANWDATLIPHWMSARGVMGEAELRHLSSLGYAQVNLAGIDDAVTGSVRNRLGGDLRWTLPAGMQLAAKADHVSDRLYVADYATGEQISSVYLQSAATLSQAGQYKGFQGDWSLQAGHIQNLRRKSNATTLQILPRLQSHAEWAVSPNFIVHVDQQSTRFNRRSRVDGWRLNVHPYIEMPWELPSGGLSAQLTAGLQHTRYWLQQTALVDSTPTRTTGEVALQVRSDFEHVGENQSWRHVISPIVRYDYIGAPMQSLLPNFDSAFGLLTWSNLLSGNRFSGLDRIEKTNRFSFLLENRLQFKELGDAAARDVLIVRGGVSYDLAQKSVDTALKAAPTRPFSNLLGELTWRPVSYIRIYNSGQYNAGDRYWASINSSLTLSVSDNKFKVGYRFTDARYATQAQLFNVSTSVSLVNRWKATGNWQYDMLLKLSQQTSIGIQYTHPCWTVGLDAYKTNSPAGTGTSSNYGFHLLLEFKGLGSVGSS